MSLLPPISTPYSPSILALETSTEWCSVALIYQGRDFIRHEKTGTQSSQRILPMVAEVLAEAGIQLNDCDAIAFGEGPGAFTGLRTACGVVQGLAFGADLPVIAVDTLMSCAQAYRQTYPETVAPYVLVALDARMSEVYWAAYRWENNYWQKDSTTLVSQVDKIEITSDLSAILGNASEVYATHFPITNIPKHPTIMPHALSVAQIGQLLFQQGKTLSPANAAPVYIRDKVALTTAERQLAAEKIALAEAQHVV